MQMPTPDKKLIKNRARLVRALKRAAPDCVVDDPIGLKVYECDALSAYRRTPLAACLPRSTEEVARIIRVCAEFGAPIYPRGAGTSLVGGSTPSADGVILGVSRMNKVLHIDQPNRIAHVQTGVTNLAVTKAVEQDGFFYAPDPSSQLACAIAGNIAMNSGGAHCLKYGVTTNNLLGVRMVTAAGEIIDLGGPHVEESGYDLLSLICGSEGQLGVVTEAWLRILPKPENARPILLGFDSSKTAGECVSDIIRSGLIPVALEFMDGVAIRACENYAKAGYPVDAQALLIAEVEGSEAELEMQLRWIKEIAQRYDPVAIIESGSEEQSARIWAGRKAAFSAIGQSGDYICLDGSIPVGALAEVLEKIAQLARARNLGVANVFHAGDGNLHPLIIYDGADPDQLSQAEALGADILRACVDAGGCLTGEHGVGLEKRDLMNRQFTPTELSQQMAIKDAFDPQWLFNPGKVFPLDAVEQHLAGVQMKGESA